MKDPERHLPPEDGRRRNMTYFDASDLRGRPPMPFFISTRIPKYKDIHLHIGRVPPQRPSEDGTGCPRSLDTGITRHRPESGWQWKELEGRRRRRQKWKKQAHSPTDRRCQEEGGKRSWNAGANSATGTLAKRSGAEIPVWKSTGCNAAQV